MKIIMWIVGYYIPRVIVYATPMNGKTAYSISKEANSSSQDLQNGYC